MPEKKGECPEYEISASASFDSLRADGSPRISFNFDGVPLGQACEEIALETNVDVFCSKDVFDQPVSGFFSVRQVRDALELLAASNNLQLEEKAGAYVLTSRPASSLSVVRVYRLPPLSRPGSLSSSGALNMSSSSSSASSVFDQVLRQLLTDRGAVFQSFGSSLVVMAPLSVQDEVEKVLDAINKNQSISYLCDVYFLRLKYNDYLNLSAALDVDSGLDLLAPGANFDELFSMYADLAASNGKNKVDQRPALLLSDSVPTSLKVGSELTREKKQVSSEGYSSTSGYEKFQDGLELVLTPRKLSGGLVSLDFSLSISTFDQSEKGADSSSVPKSDKTSLAVSGLVMRDGALMYLGSIDRRDESGGLSLFGFSRIRSSDVLTIWARVREIKL